VTPTPDPIPPPRSVLVTGASGLVGRRLVAALAADPGPVERIVALDVRQPAAGALPAGVVAVRGDVRDPALAKRLEEHEADTVVHLAAVVSPGPGSTEELEYSIDVLGTENVLRACLSAGVRQLVYASSGAAYGYHADNPSLLREEDPLRGNDAFAYARHKRLAEEVLARARRTHPELFEARVVVGVRGAEAPFVLIWDEDVARILRLGILERRTGVYNLAGDGAISLREVARRLGKPYLPLPAWLLRGGLAVARALRLSSRGPEGVDFLRYRPVLCNERLVRTFGVAPASSEACFERYRHGLTAAGAGAPPRSG
jgi:UDP-glucose 4-epimerase